MQGGRTRAQAVPTVCLGLLQHLEATRQRLTHLRMVCIGGAACPPSLMQVRPVPPALSHALVLRGAAHGALTRCLRAPTHACAARCTERGVRRARAAPRGRVRRGSPAPVGWRPACWPAWCRVRVTHPVQDTLAEGASHTPCFLRPHVALALHPRCRCMVAMPQQQHRTGALLSLYSRSTDSQHACRTSSAKISHTMRAQSSRAPAFAKAAAEEYLLLFAHAKHAGC